MEPQAHGPTRNAGGAPRAGDVREPARATGPPALAKPFDVAVLIRTLWQHSPEDAALLPAYQALTLREIRRPAVFLLTQRPFSAIALPAGETQVLGPVGSTERQRDSVVDRADPPTRHEDATAVPAAVAIPIDEASDRGGTTVAAAEPARHSPILVAGCDRSVTNRTEQSRCGSPPVSGQTRPTTVDVWATTANGYVHRGGERRRSVTLKLGAP